MEISDTIYRLKFLPTFLLTKIFADFFLYQFIFSDKVVLPGPRIFLRFSYHFGIFQADFLIKVFLICEVLGDSRFQDKILDIKVQRQIPRNSLDLESPKNQNAQKCLKDGKFQDRL